MWGKEIFTGHSPCCSAANSRRFLTQSFVACGGTEQTSSVANIGEQYIGLSIADRRSCTSLLTDLHEVIHVQENCSHCCALRVVPLDAIRIHPLCSGPADAR